MYYFEVLYKIWSGEKKRAIVATPFDTPITPTITFNFNWNGNQLIMWKITDKESYEKKEYKYIKEEYIG